MKVLYYSLITIVIDQITKVLVKGFKISFLGINHKGLEINSSIKLFDEFLQITHVENYGLAFGIEIGRDFKVAITIFTIIAAGMILYYLYLSRFKDFKIRLAVALILGGAVGNIIDRVFYGVIYGYAPLFHGRVVDFIHIDFFDYTLFGKTYQSLPIFNFADVAVLVGIVMLLYLSFKSKLVLEEGDVSNSNENKEQIEPITKSNDNQENDSQSN